jgi:hypothetical protein
MERLKLRKSFLFSFLRKILKRRRMPVSSQFLLFRPIFSETQRKQIFFTE